MKFLSFRGPDNGFKTFNKDDPRYVKLLHSDLPKNEKRAALKALGRKMMKELHGEKEMFLLIRGATFRGPLNKPETPFNVRLFGHIKRADAIERCLPIIKRTAERLFRRPVSNDVLEAYYDIARSEYAQSKNSYQAVKVTLNAVLCSPHFLFKFEGDQAELDDHMIAARLSYFLWNSTPDVELLELASKGRLKDPTIRRQQALRMLAVRNKSDRFTANFTQQWLGLHKFGAYTPNEAYIPNRLFVPLKPHLQREPQEFFNEVLHDNLSSLNFIHSDFVVWNQHLASHYQRGTPNTLKVSKSKRDAPKDDFYRRQLVQNPGMVRGGLVSMSSIMSLTTDGENTHPILRGVWVARRMLGIEIEPPASVPAIEVNLGNVSKPREILAKHKEDRSCYACHIKFDHYGLALENYDVIGRWKTEYVHPIQDEKGKFKLVTKDSIDSRAETPDGKPMRGVQGVKEYLLANKDTVMRNLAETLFSYALGRDVRYKDHAQVDALLAGMKKSDYALRDLIVALVESESFTKR